MKKKIIIVLLVFCLSGCFLKSNEYQRESQDDKDWFYERNKAPILKGKRLDMKCISSRQHTPLRSMYEIYFKNEKFEEIKKIEIIMYYNDALNSEKKIEFDNPIIFERAYYSKGERPVRFLKFDLEQFIGKDKEELSEEMWEEDFIGNRITFKYYFKDDCEIFDFNIDLETLMKSEIVKTKHSVKYILDNYEKYDTTIPGDDYRNVLDNCYIAYLYDKELWKKLVTEYYDALLASKYSEEILSERAAYFTGMFFPFTENRKRTRDDCIFVYNLFKKLCTKKEFLSKGAKLAMVDAYEKINEEFHFYTPKEMERIQNLDWENEMNDIEDLFKEEIVY